MCELVIELHTLLIGELLSLSLALGFEIFQSCIILFDGDVLPVDREGGTSALVPESLPAGEEVSHHEAGEGDPEDHHQEYGATTYLL